MKPKLFSERGQALILIAFAAIALFAIAGLAIDGTAKYADRRHAQNAADTAALAGALQLSKEKSGGGLGGTCPPAGVPSAACANVINTAKDMADKNGYTDDKVTSFVDVYVPPISGYYSGANCVGNVHFNCDDYVQVVITSIRQTWFMRVFGIKETTNVVTAWANTISNEDMFDIAGSAVVALSPSSDCSQPSLMSQGSSNVTIIGGGLFSNSDSSTCAFFRQSCPSGTIGVYTDDTKTTEATITMVGNTTSGCITTSAQFQSGAQQIPFPPPYQQIAEPAQCSEAADTKFVVSSQTATLQPGHYSKWPLTGSWKNMILTPGVYCIDTTFSSPTISITVSGTSPDTDPGVFIYIRSGGSFTFNGGSTINLWGINDASVTADSSLEPYNKFLMYVAPNYSTGTPATCNINGNDEYALKGTIYAPYCNITINGTSDTGNFRSQVIGYNVKFAGTANVVLNYDTGSPDALIVQPTVGLAK